MDTRVGPISGSKESFHACPSGINNIYHAPLENWFTIQGYGQCVGHTPLWMTVSEEVKEMVTVNIMASLKKVSLQSILEACGAWQYHM